MEKHKLSLIKTSDSRQIDPYELYARYKGENWIIEHINFNNYTITVSLRSETKTINLSKVEILESR